jgi:hypothetical protein
MLFMSLFHRLVLMTLAALLPAQGRGMKKASRFSARGILSAVLTLASAAGDPSGTRDIGGGGAIQRKSPGKIGAGPVLPAEQ